jgi:lysine 6-dehydrogenase
MRVAILGCGMEGRRVAHRLAASKAVSHLIVADKYEELASKLAGKIGPKAASRQVDVTDRKSLEEILEQVNITFNGVGPYYKYAFGVIQAAIAQKVHYVDLNDDYDAVEELFLRSDYDAQAKQAGITVLCCIGATPGLTNVLAKYGSQQLEQAKAVHCYFAYNYYGGIRTVTEHMLHCLSGEVTQFLGGKYVKVKPFGGREAIKFLNPVASINSVEAYYCGHSEPITLPRFIPGLEEATLKLSCYQPEANILLSDLVKYGFANRDRIAGLAESPADYIAEYMASPEGAPYFDIKMVEGDNLVMQVEVLGESNGQQVRLLYEVHDQVAHTIAGSAAVAIESLIRGEISTKGLVAPEGCIDPVPFLREITQLPGVTLKEKREVMAPLCL